MSYYPQLFPAQPLRRFFVAVNGQRLLNLVTLERFCLFFALCMLMVPVVLRRFLYVYTFDPFLFALYALWFVRAASHRQSRVAVTAPGKLRITPTEMVGLLLLGWIVLTTLTALNRYTSLLYLLLLFRGGLFYFYFRQNTGTVISATDLRRIVILLLLVQCVVAVVQFATNSRIGSVNDYFGELVDHPNAYFQSSLGRIIRAVGTFHNPNLLGNWIILLVPFVYASLYWNIVRRRTQYFFLLTLGVTTLMVTFSRSGWFSFAVACAVVFVRLIAVNMSRLLTLVRRFARYGLILLLLLAATLAVIGWYVQNLSFTLVQDRFGNVAGGGEWRLGYVDLAIQLFMHAPLTGVGLGNFAEAVDMGYRDIDIPAVLNSSVEFSTVHNLWLQFLAETGLAGAFLLSIFTFGIVTQLWRLPSRKMVHDPGYLVLTIWLLGGLVGFFVNSVFEAVFFHQSVLMFLFSLLGIMTALVRHQRRTGIGAARRVGGEVGANVGVLAKHGEV